MISLRVGGAGGFGGAQAPPSFSDLFSKNFQNLQHFHNFIFFYLVGPPNKKFASAHPAGRALEFTKKYNGIGAMS